MATRGRAAACTISVEDSQRHLGEAFAQLSWCAKTDLGAGWLCLAEAGLLQQMNQPTNSKHQNSDLLLDTMRKRKPAVLYTWHERK